MLPIDSRIASLKAEITLWSRLLRENEKRLLNLECRDFVALELTEDGDSIGVTAGFALEALVAAAGRLRDAAFAATRFWPVRKSEFDEVGRRYALVETAPQFLERLGQDRLLLWNILLNEHPFPSDEEPDEESNDEHACLLTAFDGFCAVRRTTARVSALTETGFSETAKWAEILGIVKSEDLNKKIGILKERLERADKVAYIAATRNYLASEYLFPWLTQQRSEPTQAYHRTLFESAQLGEKTMMSNPSDVLDQIFQELEIDDESAYEVKRIFGRIAAVITEVGDLDTVVRRITAHGGQWGADSMVGSSGPVNVIPATDRQAPCHGALIAFARGKHPRNGLKPVLRQIREHLIRCGDSSCRRDEPTRIVILFTDLWDKATFSESLGDIQAHLQSRPLRKFVIGALVNGRQVTPQRIC